MSKIQVLGHEIAIEADITLDQEMLYEVHDAVKEQIEDGKREGMAEMFCESDEDHPYTPVDVKWKIVDWKSVADKLADAVYGTLVNEKCADMDSDDVEALEEAMDEYNKAKEL